jgi:outer membrane protein TolC
MLMLSNVLALALIVADEPKPSEPLPAPAVLPKMSKPRTHDNPEAQEIWHLTLPEAIRIGLVNSEVIRVISRQDGEPPEGRETVIARLNADASVWNFKAAVMAHVRSIEQQYWALSHQHVVLGSCETALRTCEEILRRERAEPEIGHGRNADIAEAEQRLENFQLNLVSATSDVITTERQLRNILGLPPADNRRIIPSTPPTEAKVSPDWEISVGEMLESQPDLAQQRALVRLTELQLLLARNQLLPPLGLDLLRDLGNLGHTLEGSDFWGAALALAVGTDPAGFRDPEFIEHQVGLKPKVEPVKPEVEKAEPAAQKYGMFTMPIDSRTPLANTRQAQYQLLRQRAFLQQITHQSTHSLARFFLEIDANYKQYRTAHKLRDEAQRRLEAQRAFYEEGPITIDRLLDAVTQHANAIAQESLYKCTYNTSIAAFEESKGTLLAYDKISVTERPQGRQFEPPAKVDAVAPAAFEPPAEPAPAADTKAQPAPMMYKLKARIGGLKFLEIEVEVKPASPGR